MILNDKQIKKLVKEEDMISPFVDKSVAQGISYGLNSFGFDLRCGEEFKILLISREQQLIQKTSPRTIL